MTEDFSHLSTEELEARIQDRSVPTDEAEQLRSELTKRYTARLLGQEVPVEPAAPPPRSPPGTTPPLGSSRTAPAVEQSDAVPPKPNARPSAPLPQPRRRPTHWLIAGGLVAVLVVVATMAVNSRDNDDVAIDTFTDNDSTEPEGPATTERTTTEQRSTTSVDQEPEEEPDEEEPEEDAEQAPTTEEPTTTRPTTTEESTTTTQSTTTTEKPTTTSAFGGISGSVNLTWTALGIEYFATVTVNGTVGTSFVTYYDSNFILYNIEYNLVLDKVPNGPWVYVGQDARVAGTNTPANYSPDSFRLEQKSDGLWYFVEVCDRNRVCAPL